MSRPTSYLLPSTFSRLTRKRLLLAAAFVLFAILFAPRAFAGTEKIVQEFIGWVMQLYIRLIGNAFVVLTHILIIAAQYNDFVNSAAVMNGWVIVRDLANMFFVLILLVIAFATIFGVQEYSYKKLLPKLLIIAVLINFSRVIAGLAIDFGQVVMLTFVNGFKEAAGGNFFNGLGINQLNTIIADDSVSSFGGWDAVGGLVLAAVIVSVATIAVLVMLAALIYRMVMLWVYIVLSPIAFLMGTFPQGQKYYSQWWEQFTSLIIVGPVLAFFIWLSLLSMQRSEGTVSGLTGEWPVTRTPSGEIVKLKVADTEIGQEPNITRFIISLGLLLGGLMVSQQVAGAAAPGMGSFMGKIQKGATGAFKGTGLAMKRVSGIEALQKSYRAQRERAQEVGIPGMMATFGKKVGAGVTVGTTLGLDKTARAQRRQVYEEELTKRKSAISHLSNDQLADQAKKGKPEATKLLSERNALTPEFMVQKGLDYATMEKSFGAPLVQSQTDFKKSMYKTNPSAAFPLATPAGITSFAQALKKGDTSLENVSSEHLRNPALITAVQSQVGWSKDRWDSETKKLTVDQQSSLLQGMKTRTAEVDLAAVPDAEFGKELALKQAVAKTGALAAANLGNYDYKDIGGQRHTGNALEDHVRAEGANLNVQEESLKRPEVARAIKMAMAPDAFDKWVQGLPSKMKDALKKGSEALLNNPVLLAGPVPPDERPADTMRRVGESARRIRERAMIEGVGVEKIYGYKDGGVVEGRTMRDQFKETMKRGAAANVILNIPAAEIQSVLAVDIVDNLDPTQFVKAAKQAAQSERPELREAMRALIAQIQTSTSDNAKRLQEKIKARGFRDSGLV